METKLRGYFIMTLCFCLGVAIGHISHPLMQSSSFQSGDKMKRSSGFFLFLARSSRVHLFPLKPSLQYKIYQVTHHQREHTGVMYLKVHYSLVFFIHLTPGACHPWA